MSPKTALVVTSISSPNAVLRALAEGSIKHGWDFIVAGDSKSPEVFDLEGCRFLSLTVQQSLGYTFAELCPTKSYARKNIGYLEAIAKGAQVVVETDDDNFPRDTFWQPRSPRMVCRTVKEDQWVNVYGYFSKRFIYPRGLPLDYARDVPPPPADPQELNCPVQQGLADENPDVDATYRMLFPLPLSFDAGIAPVALADKAWCPFNSQNTTFFAEVFPLLYLPAYCSFRMTDIWRSFIAQRVLHHLGYPVLFHGATVWQERNEHSLHKDFIDEIPGYRDNNAIRTALMNLNFGVTCSIPRLIEFSYQCLIRNGWVGAEEEALLSAWLSDLDEMRVF